MTAMPNKLDILRRIRKGPDRRGNVLTIRVAREQYDRITQAADAVGKSVNVFCRDVLIEAANRTVEGR